MTREPLDSLLEALCGGDQEAAERAFLAFEPYLRMVVRRRLPPRLRAKFDSADVVQSVWADVLSGFREAGWRFADTAHLRAFLARLTRHRFVDHLRRNRTALARERPMGAIDPRVAPASRQPSPSEVAQGVELWERMLALCPASHRELLLMRRAGHSVAEIATRSGLHAGSVHRILNDLACRVAAGRPGALTPPGGPARGPGRAS